MSHPVKKYKALCDVPVIAFRSDADLLKHVDVESATMYSVSDEKYKKVITRVIGTKRNESNIPYLRDWIVCDERIEVYLENDASPDLEGSKFKIGKIGKRRDGKSIYEVEFSLEGERGENLYEYLMEEQERSATIKIQVGKNQHEKIKNILNLLRLETEDYDFSWDDTTEREAKKTEGR